MSISNNFPTISPSLNLSFALTKALDPRISFVRTTTATYYGTETAKAEENLLIRSQQFDNAGWIKTDATVTANTEVAPDGTTTADTLTADSANGNVHQSATYGDGGDATFSVFIKRKTGTGTVSISHTIFGSVTSVSVDGTWQRFSVTTTLSSGSRSVGIKLDTSGDEVYIWGAQLEIRSTATAYTPTTTQPITNYIPVLEVAAAGEARFDHNPLTFESLGLLVEESRTNLQVHSEEFDNADWTKTRASITANTIVAPSGELTGDKLVEDTTASDSHFVVDSFSTTSGTSFTASLYMKAAERTVAQIIFTSTGFGANVIGAYDLTNGTVTATGGTGRTTSITAVGNGWFRCVLTAQATATANPQLQIRLSDTFSAASPASYTGDGFSGIFIWGAQIEAGAFPTSYIQTVAATVTRNADAASMTGTNFSSWFNQEQGAIYCEYKLPTVLAFGTTRIYSISDNTFGNNITLRTNSAGSNQLRPELLINGSSAALLQTISDFSVFNKTLFGYKLGNNRAVTNGTIASTQGTPNPLNPMNRLDIGMAHSAAGQINGHIKKFSYYPQRLADAEQQGLTT